jgi:GNAT superfamily N-acetyltransferase
MRLDNVRIRVGTEADLRTLSALGNEINAIHHAAWPGIFAAAGDPGRDDAFWRPFVSEGNSVALLAEVDGADIGMVVASVVEEKASLLNPIKFCRVGSIGVTAGHRNSGVGHLLMAKVEGWAKSRGAVDIRLNVWEFNARAIEFYRELGYEVRSVSMGKACAPDDA